MFQNVNQTFPWKRPAIDLESAIRNPLNGIVGKHFEKPLQRLNREIDLRRLVVHRHDDSGGDRVEERGNQREINRRRPPGRNQDHVGSLDRLEFARSQSVSQVAEKDNVQIL